MPAGVVGLTIGARLGGEQPRRDRRAQRPPAGHPALQGEYFRRCGLEAGHALHDGAGETVCKPLLAAVGDAIYDGTGVRIRLVPFRDERVRAAVRKAGVPPPDCHVTKAYTGDLEIMMKRWSCALVALALLAVAPPSVTAQARRGQRTPPPEVVRPADQRVPAPYSYDMVRPVSLPDNLWMSELTILEMRDLVRNYGYTTALIMNGTMEANGPYLTTGKHNHVLKVMGDRIARTLGNTLLAPTVMLDEGDPASTDTPGRLVLSPTTLHAVLRDMATSLKAQGFREIFFLGDSGSNQRMLSAVAAELTQAWQGDGVLVAHIPEYYNYADVLRYQNEVLGKVELNKDLDGYHDDYYISSLILNDSPAHIRLPQRQAVGLDHINSLYIDEDEMRDIGLKIAQFRADVTVAAIKKVRAAH